MWCACSTEGYPESFVCAVGHDRGVSHEVIAHVSAQFQSLEFRTLSTFDFKASSADAIMFFDVVGHLLHDEIVDLTEEY